MFVIEFTKEALTAFGLLTDNLKGPSFQFVANEARLKVNGQMIKGEYDRNNGVISFLDDGTGTLYNALATALPAETPHYIDGLHGDFRIVQPT